MIDLQLTVSIFVALFVIEMVKAMIHEYFENKKQSSMDQVFNFMLEMAEKGKKDEVVKPETEQVS